MNNTQTIVIDLDDPKVMAEIISNRKANRPPMKNELEWGYSLLHEPIHMNNPDLFKKYYKKNSEWLKDIERAKPEHADVILRTLKNTPATKLDICADPFTSEDTDYRDEKDSLFHLERYACDPMMLIMDTNLHLQQYNGKGENADKTVFFNPDATPISSEKMMLIHDFWKPFDRWRPIERIEAGEILID